MSTPYETARQTYAQEADERREKRARSSSGSSDVRRKKRAKQRMGAFSNFSAFDKGGDNFTGKTHEEKTAEENLEEILRGNKMNLTERDQFKRKQAKEDKEQMEKAACDNKEAAAKAESAARFAAEAAADAAKIEKGRWKPGDHVEIFGLASEKGQKLNGKKAVIAKFETSSGRWQVELLKGLSTFHSIKQENLKRL